MCGERLAILLTYCREKGLEMLDFELIEKNTNGGVGGFLNNE